MPLGQAALVWMEVLRCRRRAVGTRVRLGDRELALAELVPALRLKDRRWAEPGGGGW